jgi:glycosyltransferase involved in cell wall biosynthesis
MNSPQDTPLVSVCIPTFNRADKLQRAVTRVLDGAYRNVEIVISDNASTDRTAQLCEALCAAQGNISYFRHAVNRGPAANFAFAREQARGKYFLWHGDDDYLDPDFIARCVDALENDPSLALSAGLGAYHHGDGVTAFRGNVVECHSNIGLVRALHFILFVYEASMFCGVYRVAAVRDCDMPNCLAGDWAWLAHVLLRGKAKIIPDCFVHRQLAADNTSSTYERIVATLGAPAWHARRPWLAIPLNLARYLALDSGEYRRPWTRWPAWLVFFGVALARQALLLLISQLTAGKRL